MTAKKPYDTSLAVAVKRVDSLHTLLGAHEDKLRSFLPAWTGAEWKNILATVLETAVGNDKLLQCTGQSILLSVKKMCEFGLSASKQLGQAFLIPRRNTKKQITECHLQIGYKGWIELIGRACGAIIECDVVYAGEVFDAEKGSTPLLTHKIDPALRTGDDKIVAAYSIAMYADGRTHFVVRTRKEIEAARSCSQTPDKGPWSQHYASMCKKTAILHHANYLPKQASLAPERVAVLEKALGHEEQTEYLPDHDTISPDEKALQVLDELPADKHTGQVDDVGEIPF